jgi:hypothetical protein
MVERIPLVLEEAILTPAEVALMRARHERFDRNWAWFQEHIDEIADHHAGKVIAIVDEELFSAETSEAVLALARAAHPDDDGLFIQYIPSEQAYRIYAHPG